MCVLRSSQSLEHRYHYGNDSSIVDKVWWESDENGNTISLWPKSIEGVIAGLPIIMFALSCQVNVISIYEELETASLKRMSIVSNNTVLVCMIVYLLAGGFGYLEFGSATLDNILTNFCVSVTGDPFVIAAYICITVTVVMAFPLNIFPCRYTLDIIFRRFQAPQPKRLPPRKLREKENKARLEESPKSSMPKSEHKQLDTNLSFVHQELDLKPDTSRTKHFFLTFLISGSALFCALIVPNLSVVFSLMGGTASAMIGFILPGLFAIRLGLDRSKKYPRVYRFLAWALVIGGAVAGVLSTSLTIYGMFYNEDTKSVQYNCLYLIKTEITDDSVPITT